MAGVLQQAVRGLAGRSLLFRPTAGFVRAFSSKSNEIPELEEHATGIEKREHDAIAAGNLDPFDLDALRRGPGTKEQPNIVKSMEDKRMIGCICDEDATAINYMWLHKGEMKRCGCGHWFKLVDGTFI